jgi:drug/metabolite transporter (DMT)-like permease
MARWLFWTLLTILAWGIWAILYRLIAGGLSEAHSQVISTLGVVPILIALWLMPDAPAAGNRGRGIWLAFGSGVLTCLGNIACYQALSHAKASIVVPMTALYPVVTIVLAAVLLKERFSVIQFVGIWLSLAAMVLFNLQENGEQGGLASPWVVLALIAIVLWGVTGLMQKMSTNHISARSAALWFLGAFVPVALGIVVLDPLPSDVSLKSWALATTMGFMLALGNLTILLAFASGGKASIIAPLAGLYPLVSIPIAIIALGERIGWRESLGIVCALAAVVMLADPTAPASQQASTLDTE